MKSLKVFETWQSLANSSLTTNNTTAVIIDVLRASNTIITAVANGIQEIIPVAEMDEAWQLKKQYPSYLLGGERHCQKISGFDFGNSPLEYVPKKIKGQELIFTTSNGSRALKTAETKKIETIFIASLANSKAIAEKVSQLDTHVVIICAGTLGNPSLEDTLAAGKIIAELTESSFKINDYGLIALAAYQHYKNSLFNTILKSQNGNKLIDLGMEADIEYCSQIDTTSIIPQYKKGVISIIPF